MKIIVLCGPSGCGKTTALKMLIDEIRKEGIEIENSSQIESRHGDGDVRAVINWHDHRIGICTGGDSDQIIRDNFTFLQSNECDIGLMGLRHNNRQWSLFRLLIKCGEPEIPQFVWKVGNGDIKGSKWTNSEVDSVVVNQMMTMLIHKVEVVR